jgi:hypothetical protein
MSRICTAPCRGAITIREVEFFVSDLDHTPQDARTHSISAGDDPSLDTQSNCTSVNVGIGTVTPTNVFTIAQGAGQAIADGRLNMGPHFLLRWRLFLFVFLLTSTSILAHAAPQTEPSSDPSKLLTIDEIEGALKRGADPSSVATIVRRRGVDFKFDQSAETRLLAAKANAALMVAVAQSRRVIAPENDPEVCSPGWLHYDCEELLLCVAPDADYGSRFTVIEANCARTTGVHRSQIIPGGEGDYRAWLQMAWVVCKDCKETIEQLPRAYDKAMNFSRIDVQAAHNDVDEALDKFRHRAIWSDAFSDRDTGSSEIRGFASVRRRSQMSGLNIHSGMANRRPSGNLAITIGLCPACFQYASSPIQVLQSQCKNFSCS